MKKKRGIPLYWMQFYVRGKNFATLHSSHLAPATPEKRYEKDYQKDKEQNLSEPSRSTCNSGKTKDTRNDSDYQES
jgi:hypothetical protein